MKFLTPKNWVGFQHYKDRAPAWIKLHGDLLDDFEFHCLPLASKALAPMLWLLASKYEGGKIPLDYTKIAFRLRCDAAELESAVNSLISSGFFLIEGDAEQDASASLAECLPREREEKEKEGEKELPAEAASQPKADKRGTRLPADWQLTTELAQWAITDRPGFPVAAEAAKFRDYWTAKTGKDATKADWDATWRNWVRNARIPGQPVTGKPARHTGFAERNYHEGVTEDGGF